MRLKWNTRCVFYTCATFGILFYVLTVLTAFLAVSEFFNKLVFGEEVQPLSLVVWPAVFATVAVCFLGMSWLFRARK